MKTVATPAEAEQTIRNQQADIAVVFAQDFTEPGHGVQLIVDGADPNMAQLWFGTMPVPCSRNGGGDCRQFTDALQSADEIAHNFVPAIMGMLLMLVRAMMASIPLSGKKREARWRCCSDAHTSADDHCRQNVPTWYFAFLLLTNPHVH